MNDKNEQNKAEPAEAGPAVENLDAEELQRQAELHVERAGAVGQENDPLAARPQSLDEVVGLLPAHFVAPQHPLEFVAELLRVAVGPIVGFERRFVGEGRV